MPLIAPDILAEARGLSLPTGAVGFGLGWLIWALGWRYHRFWVVSATTIIAGLIGMSGHATIGPRMLAAGLLLAIAAGLMALDLSRLIAFSAAGLAVCLTVHRVLPRFEEPVICFLLGGVIGILLYRLQIMVITSVAGTLLVGHSFLLMVERVLGPRFIASEWARNHSLGLNIVMVALIVAGVAVQGQIERWREQKPGDAKRSWFATFLGEPAREADPEPDEEPEHVVNNGSRQQQGFSSLFRRRR